MQEFQIGDLVRSVAGRDKDSFYIVVNIEADFLYLADGKHKLMDIEDAIYAIRHDPLFGLGYVRDVAKGEYSIVMGGDTYIAPILLCEGWIGLILRALPFILLGLSAFSNIFVRKRGYWLDIVIIASIVATSVNYVQTKALTNYPLILGMLILLKIKDNHDKRTQDFGNHSII